MKKVISAILAVALAAAAVTGCGTKKEAAGDKKTEILLWNAVNDDATAEEKAVYDYRMEAFAKKYPNVTVNSIQAPVTNDQDYRQTYDIAMMAGNAPTAYDKMSYTDIPSRIKDDTLADITDLFNKWQYKDKVIKTFDEAIAANGKHYAIPRSAYVIGVTYNKKVIKDAGGDLNNLPETWEDFANYCVPLVNKDLPRYGYGLVGMDWCAWPFTAWIWTAGGDMVKPNGDGTYKITFNEDAGVDTAEYLNQMIWKYGITQKNVLQSMSELSADIYTGRTCFSWKELASMNAEEISKNGYSMSDFGTMLFPVKDKSIERPAFAGGEVIIFNPKANAEQIEAAFNFFSTTLYDEDVLEGEWAKRKEISGELNMSQIPPRTDMFEKMLDNSNSADEQTKKALVDMIKVAKPEPFSGNWAQLKNEMVYYLQKIYLTENISRAEIKSLLDECAEKIYTKFPESYRK